VCILGHLSQYNNNEIIYKNKIGVMFETRKNASKLVQGSKHKMGAWLDKPFIALYSKKYLMIKM